jgi:hypothetical protein
MWQKIEDERQTRPDHMVEIKVGGRWMLGCDAEWQVTHTMGMPGSVVGMLVKPR